MSRGLNEDEILGQLDELLVNAESDNEFGFEGKYLDYYYLILYNNGISFR